MECGGERSLTTRNCPGWRRCTRPGWAWRRKEDTPIEGDNSPARALTGLCFAPSRIQDSRKADVAANTAYDGARCTAMIGAVCSLFGLSRSPRSARGANTRRSETNAVTRAEEI